MPCIARTRTNNITQVGVVATGGLGYAALMTGLAFSGPAGWLIAAGAGVAAVSKTGFAW
jgi:hypothetical protein